MKKIGIIAGLNFLAGVIFFVLTFGYFLNSINSRLGIASSEVNAETVKKETLVTRKGGPDFVQLVKKVRSAVVKVRADCLIDRQDEGDDFFDLFNFQKKGGKEKVSGIGSGFLISPDGYILTNYHLISEAIKIIVTDIGDTEYVAKKIGADPKSDLALLKIDLKNHSFIELGDSDKVEVGEWVLAIGNPLGQDLSVTSGIVSAKGRQLSGLEVDYQNYIQTDASINQGNSGGPLLNLSGQAIGINSVILSTSGGSIGLGFAIPSNMAKKVLRDLKRDGRVIRGYLGIQISEVPDEDAGQYDLPLGGVLVVKVEEESPAQKAGLRKFDLITEVNGEKVKTMLELRRVIGNYSPGAMVRITLYRDKIRKTVDARVTEAPDSFKIKSDDEDGHIIDLGMVLSPNSPPIAKQFALTTPRGIVVTQVFRNGIAEQNKLRAGDVILKADRIDIISIRQFRTILSKKGGSTISLTLIRNANEIYVKFKIPK
ncbi:MAG: trypsin-like peptidase domain-containing protein [Candidatus Omnitrophota bacterium]